jgi:hypothetical protein
VPAPNNDHLDDDALSELRTIYEDYYSEEPPLKVTAGVARRIAELGADLKGRGLLDANVFEQEDQENEEDQWPVCRILEQLREKVRRDLSN